MPARIRAALRALLAMLLLAPVLQSCGGDDTSASGPVVLAASSLQGSLEEVARAWEAAGHPAPVLSFAASPALARQIAQGAPADVFVSADQRWMDDLAGRGLLRAGSRGDVLSNRLVLVARTGTGVRSLADLGDGRLALADPAAVPAGRYARAALESRGQWQAVGAQVVPAENVRAALALVERGEAVLGIVYATDALAARDVEVLETIPQASHPPIRYPAAVLAGSRHQDAGAFRAFLSAPEAQRIFARHGFGTAE